MRNYILPALFMLALFSCGEKTEKNTENSDSTATVQRTHGTIADQARDLDYDVEHNGSAYKIRIHREACDSLPTITDDFGDVFADYAINVTILRSGERLFGRTFTKKDFASYVEEAELRACILEGIAFDHRGEDGFHFGVSISRPDSEGGNRLTMTIDTAGGITITRAQTQDVSNSEEILD